MSKKIFTKKYLAVAALIFFAVSVNVYAEIMDFPTRVWNEPTCTAPATSCNKIAPINALINGQIVEGGLFVAVGNITDVGFSAMKQVGFGTDNPRGFEVVDAPIRASGGLITEVRTDNNVTETGRVWLSPSTYTPPPPPSTEPLYGSEETTALGACDGISVRYSAKYILTNSSAYDVVFTRTAQTGAGTNPATFTVPANGSKEVTMGFIKMGGCAAYPTPTYGTASYNAVWQKTPIKNVGIPTYSWTYAQ